MIDVVYLYSAGSDATEIRYSLRSLAKHLSGIRNIYVVGDDPGIFKDILFVPWPDRHKGNRAKNIYEKILAATTNQDLSDHFLYNSDDIFLLKNFTAIDFPYFYCNTLQGTYDNLGKENSYRKYVGATMHALASRQLPTVNFNGHSPIVYHKYLYVDIMQQYDWEQPKGYISKSLYCNTLKIEGVYLKDIKISTPKTKTAIVRKLYGATMFSTDTFAINDPMKSFLQETFPEPSRWEL